MFRTNYRATLKAILRSPVTLLAFGGTILLTIALYKGGFLEGDASIYTLHQDIWNHIQSACVTMFPPIVGVMISAHILSELQNGYSDLLVSSRKSVLSIFLSKLCAVATVAIVARLLLLGVRLIWFWGARYHEVYAVADIQMPTWQVLAWYVLNEMIYMPFMLLAYTAMPVFVCAITNIPASGAIWNVFYYILSYVYTPFKATNLYVPPRKMHNYLAACNFKDNPLHVVDLSPAFFKALFAYFGWVCISLMLLTAAYFILKKRYRT